MNKKTIGVAALAVLLLLFASSLRLIEGGHPFWQTLRFLIAFVIYIGLIAAWGVSVRRRVMHKKIRFYLTLTTGCMLLLILVRTLKYHVLVDDLERWAWYAFYIPLLLIPLFAFWAALSMGKPEDYRLELRYRLLAVPTAILILGVLTNDFHQLAFVFVPEEFAVNGKYTYNILYFMVAFWALAMVLAVIFLLWRKTRIPGSEKRMWLPLGVVGVEIVYTVLYAIDSSKYRFGFIEMAAMTCVITAGIWESCIQTGLIPANTHYRTFFERSSLAVQIVDKEGNIRYTSTKAVPLDGETFLRLTEQKSVQQDENTLLNASPISGGFALWKEDISRIGRLLGQLREIGQELRENTGILKKEVEIKARETRVRERIRLYNLLSMQIKAQLKQIREALAAFPQADDALRRRLLLEAGVLGAYIKRRCNLSLMAEGNETITGDELGHCLMESAENIRLLGVECAVVIRTEKEPGNLYMMLCYDLFQAVIEAGLNGLRKVLVNLSERKNGVTFTVQVQSGGDPAALPWSDWRAEEMAALGARLSWEQTEDGVFSIALRIQEGGGCG